MAKKPRADVDFVDTETLPARLQRLMEQRGLGHSELAAKAGIGGDGVRNILRGRSLRPKSDALDRIAKVLEVSMGELTGDAPAPPAPTKEPAFKAPRRRNMLKEPPEAGPDPQPLAYDIVEESDDVWGLPGTPPSGLVDVESVDLRPVEGRTPDLLDPARRRGTLRVPADWVAASGAEPDDVVVCRAPSEGFPPDLMGGSWILVDGEQTTAARGLYVLWDGVGYLLARVHPQPGVGGVKLLVHLADGMRVELAGYHVVGRVVGRFSAL